MSTKNQPQLEVISWSDIKKIVYEVNPQLAEIITAISPSDDFKLYRAKNPFGSKILEQSKFYIPYEGAILPIDDPKIPNEIKARLNYNKYFPYNIPLGLVLNHSIELNIQSDENINPFCLMVKGTLFGLWGILKSAMFVTLRVWNITAGARCIFFYLKFKLQPRTKTE